MTDQESQEFAEKSAKMLREAHGNSSYSNLTKREFMATMAMAAILGRDDFDMGDYFAAHEAIKQTDELLNRLYK